jgi:glucans biosynthesis protein C
MLDFPNQRRNDLDWVRILAFALLVPYHVGMYYVTWDWHVKSPMASSMLEPFMILTAPWRMLLLFFISGVATAYLQAKSTNGFLAKRSKKLLIPLIFGMLVIVPPQSYYEVVEQLPGGYHEGYLTFWWQYLSGNNSFCDGDDCLDMPTWNHLWFVAYLFIYTLLIPLARWFPKPIKKIRMDGLGVLVWPVIYLISMRLLLLERFESTHGLTDDWYNHTQYLAAFLFGFAMTKQQTFWSTLCRLRWVSGTTAALSALFLVVYYSIYTESNPPADALRLFQRCIWGMQQWMVPAAIMGFAYKHWRAESPLLRKLTPAIFPLYILHQTIIVVLAHKLKALAIPPVFEGILLIILTFVLCWSGYLLVRRMRWIGPLFGVTVSPRISQTAAGLRP